MTRFRFSSDDPSAGHSDKSRFCYWCELFSTCFGTTDITRDDHLPFMARFDFVSFDSVGLGSIRGPIASIVNAGNKTDAFALTINKASMPITYFHRNREIVIHPHMATLITLNEPGGGRRIPSLGNEWYILSIKQRKLSDAVANVENMLASPLAADNQALLHLTRYLSMTLDVDVENLSEPLISHVDETVFDLVVLALGGGRDAGAIARSRGLRAARLQMILSEIENGFTDPALSAQSVATKLGLSARYVYELLHETGTGFSERVLELRLQKARHLLEDPREDLVRISDVAYGVGFNEISYFNRCFRRRFGITPTGARR
jgi:AraC-like DNA-binding protein